MAPSDTASGDITTTSEWAALARHARELQAGGVDLAGLFEADPDRSGRCTSQVGDLIIDWQISNESWLDSSTFGENLGRHLPTTDDEVPTRTEVRNGGGHERPVAGPCREALGLRVDIMVLFLGHRRPSN